MKKKREEYSVKSVTRKSIFINRRHYPLNLKNIFYVSAKIYMPGRTRYILYLTHIYLNLIPSFFQVSITVFIDRNTFTRPEVN
jgi:hypothetical protein